jgi:putative intracellular protease/amidase
MPASRKKERTKKIKSLTLLACLVFLFFCIRMVDEIVIASPAGGAIPIDQGSVADPFFTAPGKKFLHDAEAVGKLSHSVKIDTIDFATVDAIYLTGGHGTCVDFVDTPALKTAIETVFNADKKVVGAVCHGVIGLVQCMLADGKTPLVAGKTVTGFADSEEEAVQLTSIVPFLLETKLKEQGAKYEKSGDWTSKVCVDGTLVTGQNPQSSEECAAAVIQLLSV